MIDGQNLPPWWDALDRHARHEAESRHRGDDALAARVDTLESWRDQIKGAARLIYALIGSNVLLAIALVVQISTSRAT